MSTPTDRAMEAHFDAMTVVEDIATDHAVPERCVEVIAEFITELTAAELDRIVDAAKRAIYLKQEDRS